MFHVFAERGGGGGIKPLWNILFHMFYLKRNSPDNHGIAIVAARYIDALSIQLSSSFVCS